MYAAMCYQACLTGVRAMVDAEKELKDILFLNIGGEEKIIKFILKLYDINSEYSNLYP